MTKVAFTIVDAFTTSAFGGNPAAVCQLDQPATEGWMQSVAREFNLPMTAYVTRRDDGDHDLRWFTSTTEISLCGHATLATAHVLGGRAAFHTKGGVLRCQPGPEGTIEMIFPAMAVAPHDTTTLARAARTRDTDVTAAYANEGWDVLVLRDPETIRALTPDLDALATRGKALLTVAFPNDQPGVDSVCRVFNPAMGLDEDPVTGSAHCIIGPLLARATGRHEFTGTQLSARGGRVGMRVETDHVVLRGNAVTVAEGVLHV